MSRYLFEWVGLAALVGLVACAPTTAEVKIQVPAVPRTAEVSVEPASPESVVVYTTIAVSDMRMEFERIAKQVHPRYSISASTLRLSSNSNLRFAVDALSSGMTRVVFFPKNREQDEAVLAVATELERAGVLGESGVPDVVPVPVPLLTMRSGEEFFRFYRGPTGYELLNAARQCGVDYAHRTESGYSPGFEFRTTEMSDGRTRLYVRITRAPGVLEVGETQRHLGRALACLDRAYGIGEES